MTTRHHRAQRCTRPCHRPTRPRLIDESRHSNVSISPWRGLRPWLGIVIVIGSMIFLGLAAWGDDPQPRCVTPPTNAYRSGGLWYSGSTVIGPVDPYHPDCWPVP